MKFYFNHKLEYRKFNSLISQLMTIPSIDVDEIEFTHVKLSQDIAIKLCNSLLEAKLPVGFRLKFFECNLSLSVIERLVKVISIDCPESFELSLIQSKLDKSAVDLFASVLQSGCCTTGLVLRLGRDLRSYDIKNLALALQSGKCPENLHLHFDHFNEIDALGARLLSSAIASGKCPNGLHLNLANNRLTTLNFDYDDDTQMSFFKEYKHFFECESSCYGLYHLANAIITNNYPDSFVLDISGHIDFNQQIIFVFDAIANEKCTKPFTLSMGYCISSVKIAKYIAGLFEAGSITDGMILNMEYCKFGYEGLVALAKAIASDNFPKRIKLNLYGHYITRSGGYISSSDAGEQILTKAIKNNMTLLACVVCRDPNHKINLYTKRNELLFKYPMFAPLIKSFCHQHNLYDPSITFKSPGSLKFLCVRSITIYRTNIAKKTLSLPVEIYQFINDSRDMFSGLKDLTGDKIVQFPHCEMN